MILIPYIFWMWPSWELQGCVSSQSFRKSTAGNTILHYGSCHPKHIRKNIPYGNYVRAVKNCSEPNHFLLEADKFTHRLKSRGSPKWVLSNALDRAASKERSDLLKNKTKNEISIKTPVTFSTTYSVEYKKICELVKKHIPILQYDPSLSKAFAAGYRCVARRAPTIGQDLLPSLFVTTDTSVWLRHKGSVGCGHKICTCCKAIQTTNEVISMSSGTKFKILQYINCNSNNVIYVITCEMCKLQYVGHTLQKLKERIWKNLSDVPHARTRNVSAASQHFTAKHHGAIDMCSVIGIDCKPSFP